MAGRHAQDRRLTMDLRLLLTSAGPHCKPIACEEGGRAFLTLKEGKEHFAADGSGVLVASITASDLLCSNGGYGQWDYQFSIDPEEIASGETVSASDIQGVCCVDCGAAALLAKLARSDARDFTVESFRVFEDDAEVVAGDIRLFRKHNPILIHSMEVSVAQVVLEEGPYPPEPGTLDVTPLSTPVQVASPWGALGDAATVDPATSTPLTARVEFSPPVLLPGGAAFGINVQPENEGAFLGLEVHLQFSLLDE